LLLLLLLLLLLFCGWAALGFVSQLLLLRWHFVGAPYSQPGFTAVPALDDDDDDDDAAAAAGDDGDGDGDGDDGQAQQASASGLKVESSPIMQAARHGTGAGGRKNNVELVDRSGGLR
jgi:hypothetical protein